MRVEQLISRKIVEGFAREVIQGIQSNIKTKNPTGFGPMNNTGRAADSMGFEFDGTRLIIYSNWQFFWVLETGRKPGKRPPTEPLVKWVKQRGLAKGDISAESLGFLMARKIGNEGTLLHRKGGNSGIITEYTDPDFVVEHLDNRLRDEMASHISEELIKELVA